MFGFNARGTEFPEYFFTSQEEDVFSAITDFIQNFLHSSPIENVNFVLGYQEGKFTKFLFPLTFNDDQGFKVNYHIAYEVFDLA